MILITIFTIISMIAYYCGAGISLEHWWHVFLYILAASVISSLIDKYGSEVVSKIDNKGEEKMTLRNVLETISGGTKIKIHIDCNEVFSGCMSDITKEEFNNLIGENINNTVYRLNTMDGYLTIAC